jgi:hypothetical protein
MLNRSQTHATPARDRPPSARAGATRRHVAPAVALIALAVGVIWAARDLTSARQPAPSVHSERLPQTPRGWLSAYRAAIATHPARVCRDLYTASLRDRLRSELHISCEAFMRRQGPVRVRLMRVQTHGPTAVLDLYAQRTRHYSAVVLVREQGGFRVLQFIPRTAPPTTTTRRRDPVQHHK